MSEHKNDFKIDPDWAENQLRDAGYTDRHQDAIDVRESTMLLILQFNSLDTDPANKIKVLELFAKLSQGHELVGRNVMTPDARWREFNLGDVHPGSTVRVRADAYEGDTGARHNGMVGRLVAARGGEGIVQYHNSTEGAGHRHRPDKLEVLVKT